MCPNVKWWVYRIQLINQSVIFTSKTVSNTWLFTSPRRTWFNKTWLFLQHESQIKVNMWLHRDWSRIGRVVFTKAEGVSRFVYPALSLALNHSTCKETNSIFSDFVWKKKHQHLKKDIWSAKKSQMLDLMNLKHKFTVKCLKKYLEKPECVCFWFPIISWNK